MRRRLTTFIKFVHKLAFLERFSLAGGVRITLAGTIYIPLFIRVFVKGSPVLDEHTNRQTEIQIHLRDYYVIISRIRLISPEMMIQFSSTVKLFDCLIYLFNHLINLSCSLLKYLIIIPRYY